MTYSNDKRYEMLRKVMMSVRGKHDYGGVFSQYMTQINKVSTEYELDDVVDAIIFNEKTRAK